MQNNKYLSTHPIQYIAIICIFLLSGLSHANQQTILYQVDMIIFSHQQPSATYDTGALSSLVTPNAQHAIPLQNTVNGAMTPYHTLPASASQLSSEYWALNRKTNYQVLAHYSWLQPANNQRAVALSIVNHNGWHIKGTLRIRRSNYYLLDTDLLFTMPNKNNTSFLFSQKRRLKAGTVYYLDHPQAGMLIKVHQIN